MYRSRQTPAPFAFCQLWCISPCFDAVCLAKHGHVPKMIERHISSTTLHTAEGVHITPLVVTVCRSLTWIQAAVLVANPKLVGKAKYAPNFNLVHAVRHAAKTCVPPR